MIDTEIYILAAFSFIGAIAGGVAGLALLRLIVFLRERKEAKKGKE